MRMIQLFCKFMYLLLLINKLYSTKEYKKMQDTWNLEERELGTLHYIQEGFNRTWKGTEKEGLKNGLVCTPATPQPNILFCFFLFRIDEFHIFNIMHFAFSSAPDSINSRLFSIFVGVTAPLAPQVLA